MEKWKVERCYEVVHRSEAYGKNIVTCRFVHRWKPEDSAAAGSQVIADRRQKLFDVNTTSTAISPLSADANMLFKPTSRLCLHGFKDWDWFTERSSPTARKESRRILMNHSLHENWPIVKVDAERAYLQPEKLEREIFAEPPVEAGLGWEWLWRILKPVYGLNDAARLFFEFCWGSGGDRVGIGWSCTGIQHYFARDQVGQI